MRIIAKRTLIEFWQKKPEYKDAKAQLEACHKEVKHDDWKNPTDVLMQVQVSLGSIVSTTLSRRAFSLTALLLFFL